MGNIFLPIVAFFVEVRFPYGSCGMEVHI